MGKKIRIGIHFNHYENWIGGTYYITNLVSALGRVAVSPAPKLVVISWSHADYERIRETGYSNISFFNLSHPLNIMQRAINKLSKIFSGKYVIHKIPSDRYVDIFFPASVSDRFKNISRKIFWIPDFQEMYYPAFFSDEQIAVRKETCQKMIESGHTIVFSSKNAQEDFNRQYPAAKNHSFVLSFAVTHPEYESLDIGILRKKYQIDRPYFIVPNQFWQHKNQGVVLRSLSVLKDRINFQIVFTGKESDVRNPDYFPSLNRYVEENGLTDKVRFLGFIDRRDQLKLMKESLAIIQPSLFEGWSTVVEDAKAMSKFILLSDLPVHREQINGNCIFFNPMDENELALKMNNILIHGIEKEERIDYSEDIAHFGKTFMQIVNATISR